MNAVLKFQRQRRAEENFLKGAELDHRAFLQTLPAHAHRRELDGNPHGRSAGKKFGEFIDACRNIMNRPQFRFVWQFGPFSRSAISPRRAIFGVNPRVSLQECSQTVLRLALF